MLTDREIKGFKPESKKYKKYDQGGLFLFITPAGSKLWRFRYRIGGKEPAPISLGKYPEVSLLEARKLRDDCARLLADGKDPAKFKVDGKVVSDGLPFDKVANEWMDKKKWEAGTRSRNERIITQDLSANLVGKGFADIKPMDILACIKKIEERGAHEVASRARGMASEIFCYGIGRGYCETDPAAPLQKALIGGEKKQRPAITEPRLVGQMIRAIRLYDNFIVRNYLLFTAYSLLRPGESRLLEWSEINWDERRIELPAERMLKTRLPHLVPLSDQAFNLLKSIQAVTGRFKYVFTSSYRVLKNPQPISNATALKALRIMGIEEEDHCVHGFRSTASTNLNEAVKSNGDKMWHGDWVERQLGHISGAKNAKVRAAYNRAAYWKPRQDMMQWYADFLDNLASKQITKI